jgi:ABC-type glucose/galactose transport system permease subunit
MCFVVVLFLDRTLLTTLFPLVYICGLPPLCQLRWNLTFGCVGEFVCANNVLTPFVSTRTSLEAIYVLQALHLLDSDSPCLNFLMDFQSNTCVELSMDSFKSTFLHMSHLFAICPLGIIYFICSFFLGPSTSFVL